MEAAAEIMEARAGGGGECEGNGGGTAALDYTPAWQSSATAPHRRDGIGEARGEGAVTRAEASASPRAATETRE